MFYTYLIEVIGSYMQTRLRPYLASFGLSLLTIGGCTSPISNPQYSATPTSTSSSIAPTIKSTDKPQVNHYSKAFIKDYTDGCVSAITNMKTESEKKAACTCVLDKAQEFYTEGEFVKASQTLNMEKQTPPKLFEIVISCVKK